MVAFNTFFDPIAKTNTNGYFNPETSITLEHIARFDNTMSLNQLKNSREFAKAIDGAYNYCPEGASRRARERAILKKSFLPD